LLATRVRAGASFGCAPTRMTVASNNIATGP
jgi:hypothetical protein